jgi:adenylate cyclase
VRPCCRRSGGLIMVRSQQDIDKAWKELLAGTMTPLHKARMGLRAIPSAPRCKLCLAPFGPPGGPILRLAGRGRWEGNPALCRICIGKLAKISGGAEVEISVLFADIRGSTGVAESMSPSDFRALLNRFYQEAAQAVDKAMGVVDKFLGDGILALFVPGIGGPDHPRQAVEAGVDILQATGNASATEPPWLPVGAGIHTGIAFVGSVGTAETVDFTALGDTVNSAARLGEAAKAGELLISVETAVAARIDGTGLELRTLELKGRSQPLNVLVLRPE